MSQHRFCSSRAVVEVKLSELDGDNDVVRGTFQHLLLESGDDRIIVVTDAMRELYDVTNSEKKFICLVGPPGVGKTTALYWLYKQLLHSKRQVVLVPFSDDLTSEHVRKIKSTSNCIILMDVVSPSFDSKEKYFGEFLKIACGKGRKIILALSSSFEIYASLQARKCSDWCMFRAKAKTITFEPWNDTISKCYLQLNNLNTNNEGVKACKGIARLLSVYQDTSASVNYIKTSEWNTVLSYMTDHKARIVWKNEIAILMAAKFELTLDDVGLNQESAERTVMVKSYLVSIKSSPPSLYYPNESFDDDMIVQMWENMCNACSFKCDNESTIGDYFECQVPHTLCRGDTLALQVKKVNSEGPAMDIKFSLSSAGSGRLVSMTAPLPSKNVLWRCPKSCKAIDFIAKVETELPTIPGKSDVLLLIQVTTQTSNMSNKFQKSVVGIESEESNLLLFVMLNPRWTDFNTNFEHVASCISGPAIAKNKRFRNLWYGQPVSFQPYKALLATLINIFQYSN